MTAPATGRTADENEMREGIAKTIYEAFPIYCNNPSPKCAIWPWHVPPSANSHAPYYAVADALLSGPLAPILQEAATARKERDEAILREETLRGASLDAEHWAQEAATLRARLQEAEKIGEAMRAELSRRPPEHGRTFTCPKCGIERGWCPACMQDGCPVLGFIGEEVTHVE